MNMQGVVLHLMADALGSIIVILSGFLVKFAPDSIFNWSLYIDPILSILLSAFIIISALPLLKESSKVLLQTSRIDVQMLKKKILEVSFVTQITSFHLWSLDSLVNVSSIRLCVNSKLDNESYTHIKNTVRDLFKRNGVQSVTIEVEFDLPDSQQNFSKDNIVK
jgi:zinc transporter 1